MVGKENDHKSGLGSPNHDAGLSEAALGYIEADVLQANTSTHFAAFYFFKIIDQYSIVLQ